MGLAPYANQKHAEKVTEIFKNYLGLDKDNPLLFKKKIIEDSNYILRRLERDLKRKRFDNIAAGLQYFGEELVKSWVKECIKKTGIRDLLCSGGVFMNIKINKLLAELKEVSSISIFPSCGDESNALGAAWAMYYKISKKENFNPLSDYYLGPCFEDQEAEKIILDELKSKDSFSFVKDNQINKTVVQLLAKGEIVARCSGRMEFGARALGNRSILTDPVNQKIVNIINKMIKCRDFWMPFAPVVLKEKSKLYLQNPKDISSPYMMMGFDTTDKRNDFIAAIHSADNSARPQILEKNQNSDMEEIINEFEKNTGRAILLNTSFNLHGYPIVFGPKEAIWTFNNSGLKYLVINNFLLTKK